jgi:transposase
MRFPLRAGFLPLAKMRTVPEASGMLTEGQALVRGGELTLPWNLGEWIAPDTLSAWTGEEIATLDWGNPAVEEFLRQRPRYEPRKLLHLVALAYLTGTFESEEIQLRCQRDAEFRVVTGAAWLPSTGDLTRFRRENRGLLKWVLANVMRRTLRSHLGDTPIPAGLKRRVIDAAVSRLDYARQMDQSREREDI